MVLADKMGSIGESPVAMSYFAQQQQTFKPPLIANENAFLGDVATSEHNDPKSPVSCGFYRLEKGTQPLPPLPSFSSAPS